MNNPDAQSLLFDTDAIRPGDAVVHFEHGLAEYAGTETTDLGDTTQELVTFIYRNGGKLLLPAVEGKDFWAYGAPAKNLTLDRLNSEDWEQRRDEMIAELKAGADALAKEDRERRSFQAFQLQPDKERYKRFADSFAYPETADQSAAVGNILDDLDSETPMNRLLVGDVGFGKTEVAFRAMAAAVLTGKQAILVAPTTVLARQHYQSACERFADADVVIAEVSRLSLAENGDEIIESISSGRAKIIIGTHAILNDELTYPDLALVVIDEEQKFGREQKIGLRHLSRQAHILSMTATPIPRSLAAAEVGLLEVSVLATPPDSRQPIATDLDAMDAAILRDAITAETSRGGQCFVVCPRIAGCEEVAEILDGEDLDFSFTIAHGQLDDEEMDARMMGFMNGDVDVLVSTTIVESGVDNPRANAMVVWNADKFGLSQLHQLRGRIGRSDIAAHMVLLTNLDVAADTEAVARLKSFCELTDIGAGFEIAKRDRDIRGFGELDGSNQSGQISRLGIHLYRHILKEHFKIGQSLPSD